MGIDRPAHGLPLERRKCIPQVEVQEGGNLARRRPRPQAPAHVHQHLRAAGEGDPALPVCEEETLEMRLAVGGYVLGHHPAPHFTHADRARGVRARVAQEDHSRVGDPVRGLGEGALGAPATKLCDRPQQSVLRCPAAALERLPQVFGASSRRASSAQAREANPAQRFLPEALLAAMARAELRGGGVVIFRLGLRRRGLRRRRRPRRPSRLGLLRPGQEAGPTCSLVIRRERRQAAR